MVPRLGGYENQLTVSEYTQMLEPNPQSTKSETQGGLCIDTLYSIFLMYSDAQQSLRLILERIIENTLEKISRPRCSQNWGIVTEFLRNVGKSGDKLI